MSMLERVEMAIREADIRSTHAEFSDLSEDEVRAMADVLAPHHREMAIAAMEAMGEPTEGMIERVARAIQENIKVDATGLSPAVASAFIVGIEDAAKAAFEAMRDERRCETCDDDPLVCASVPGLRHCERASRRAE